MGTNRFVGLVVFVILCGAGLLLYVLFSRSGERATLKPETLVNPVAGLVANHNLALGERIALQDKLEDMGETALLHDELTNFGIYYRELISGPVITIRQNEGFFPASLLKIPVVLWYYKKAESEPGLLDAEVDYVGPPGTSIVHFPPKETLVPGTRYSLRELLRFMLAESDNEATNILIEYAGGREAVNAVYADLGFMEVDDYNHYVIDTQTYVAFFRVLFNAEYLSETASEEVLNMLASSSFTEGLVAGVPGTVVVAHKFGERTIDGSEERLQLHDCGIIYVPENPYMLCVMTQGHNYEVMAQFIADVSRSIYEAAAVAP